MSLFQSPLKRHSAEYKVHYKKHAEIIKNRDAVQASLLNQLGKTLTIEQYKEEKSKKWAESKAELSEYFKTKKKLKKEQSFLGRANFKFWLFQFGLIILGFYFSCKSLIDDLKKQIKTGHEIISIIGISVSLFWLYHLFFQTASDFYTETYLIFKFIVSLAVGYFISRLIKYYTTKEGVVKSLVDLIFRIKKTHYRNIVVKALYAEKYDRSLDTLETVKSQANAFDKDVNSTIKQFV
ncbi:hypothetical protein PL371_05225 [Tenacibaculum maritimum]|nr:hypothetical protein [Tenacibaculum maritimum]MDB0611282.1 hypothetical protein [Tenacibaculum maritimum]